MLTHSETEVTANSSAQRIPSGTSGKVADSTGIAGHAAERLPEPSRRMRSLDVLRGIAAMLVLIRHTPVVPGVGDSVLERGFHFVQTAGWIGVDLFFVLSGFLIAGLLFHEIDGTGRVRLKRFWLRRGLKIWPSYFAAYGAAWLLGCLWAGYRGDQTALFKLCRDFVPNALFVQNYVSCERWPHSWTLAVEEHFYIVLPILLALFYRSKNVDQRPALKSVVVLWVLFATTICSLRLWNASTGVNWSVNYYRSHLRADSLMFGVFLAWLHRSTVLSGRTVRVLMAVAIPLVVAAFVFVDWFPLAGPVTSTVGFTFLYAVCGLLVLLAAIFPNAGETWPRPIQALVRGLSWIGVYSYTIYLAHSVVFAIPGVATATDRISSVVLHLGFSHTTVAWLNRFGFIVISIAGGVILSWSVERPLLRRRAKWAP